MAPAARLVAKWWMVSGLSAARTPQRASPPGCDGNRRQRRTPGREEPWVGKNLGSERTLGRNAFGREFGWAGNLAGKPGRETWPGWKFGWIENLGWD